MAPKPRELSVERWTVLHFPALARFIVAGILGLTAFWFASSRMQMGLAFLVGWDTIAASVLLAVWPVIVRLDCARTRELSTREDETRATAGLLEVGASTVSLVGVFYALGQASHLHGIERIVMTTAAMITIVLSWLLVSTVFMLRYAHLHFVSTVGGLDFHGDTPPDYLDFAYLAFTVGMTYQVSDTEVRDPAIRRAVLRQALISYLFGAVIIAATINVVAGFVH